MKSEDIITTSFQVRDVQRLKGSTYRIKLFFDKGIIPVYKAGQYLELLLSDNERSAFSIASAPEDKQQELELHIQKIPGKESSEKLFAQLKSGTINACIGKGCCYVDKLSNSPLLLIAAGTGFAQMKGIIEYTISRKHPYPTYLYWGGRTPADIYLPELPSTWLNSQFEYHPVISDTGPDSEWTGRFGLLYEAVLSDKKKLLGSEVYISGSAAMVYATVDALVAEGFSEKRMHSDVFEYAPR